MTPQGADLMARRHGYRYAGLVDPLADPTLRAITEATVVGFLTPGPRFMAVFVPEPDDGRGVVLSDGRTLARALRRGLDLVGKLERGTRP